MTHKHVDKNPVRPITKTHPNLKLDTDQGESATSSSLSEDSISGMPTGSSEDSTPIETPQVPTVSIKSTQDKANSNGWNNDLSTQKLSRKVICKCYYTLQ